MNRTVMFLMIGLALMVGLYLYDRDNRTEVVFATQVISVESIDPGEGPDEWHVKVIGLNGEAELEPLNTRPTLEAGQQTCVIIIKRSGQQDEYRWAPSASC